MFPFAILAFIITTPTYSELLGLILVWIFAYTFWHFNFYGGADAKSIMLISLFIPQIVILPIALWVLLCACLLQLLYITLWQNYTVTKPFMPAICISVLIILIFVHI